MVVEDGVFGTLELELRRGIIVLATLSQLRTFRYGYELRQALAEHGLPVEEGTLYPLLRRLESQGVLHSEWRTGQGQPRRYYQLSPQGRRLNDRLTKSWRELNDVIERLQKGNESDES
jgi:DNA-binding PadR family transcriptional regulator